MPPGFPQNLSIEARIQRAIEDLRYDSVWYEENGDVQKARELRQAADGLQRQLDDLRKDNLDH